VTSTIVNPELDRIAEEVLAVMDRSGEACDDFYQFACGGWLENTTVPETATAWARSIDEIEKRNLESLQQILDAQWPLISTLYKDCQNTTAINALGAKPLNNTLFQKLLSIQDRDNLMQALGLIHLLSVDALFSFRVAPEPALNKMIVFVGPGDLGLQVQDYNNKTITDAYQAHIDKIFNLIERPSFNAAAVVMLETELAKKLDAADPDNTPYPETIEQFKNYHAIGDGWKVYFSVLGISESSTASVTVLQPAFVKAVTDLIKMISEKPDTMQSITSYLAYHLVAGTAEV